MGMIKNNEKGDRRVIEGTVISYILAWDISMAISNNSIGEKSHSPSKMVYFVLSSDVNQTVGQ